MVNTDKGLYNRLDCSIFMTENIYYST